jgi:hypothetical protein
MLGYLRRYWRYWNLAWQSFRKAAADDAGWDMASTTAEVRPCSP